MPKVSREPNNQSRAKTAAPAVTRPAARERHCDCSSATLRFLVRQNLVVSQASKSRCGKRTTRSRPAALDKL